MRSKEESFWNSKATGRDVAVLGLGLLSGAALGTIVLLKPAPAASPVIGFPTVMSDYVTPGVGTYQIAVSDSILWRINTATGELYACGVGTLENGQPAIACSPMTQASPKPAPMSSTPRRPKHQPTSW